MLQFDNNDQFRILILADIQDTKPLKTDMQDHLDLLIKESNPNLIVLLGDMIFGLVLFSKSRAKSIITSIIGIIEKHNIPFAFIAGNHDMEGALSIEEQIELYCSSACCISPSLTVRECPGSYSLFVHDSNSNPKIHLLFHDSGSTILSLKGVQYKPLRKDQIDYQTKALSNYINIPTYVFQHVPVLEIYKLVKTVDKGKPGAVKHGKEYIVLRNPEQGTLGEAPCPPVENDGEFDIWKERGNVKAAVFGHDHKNSFVGEVDGISFLQTPSAGLASYGDPLLRGGRVLTLYLDGTFKTHMIRYQDYFTKIERTKA